MTGTAASVDIAGGTNPLAAIGPLTVTSGLTVVDTGPLAVTGAVSANAVSLNAGTIGVAASVLGNSIILTGGSAASTSARRRWWTRPPSRWRAPAR